MEQRDEKRVSKWLDTALTSFNPMARCLDNPHASFQSYSTIRQAGLMEYAGPLINLKIMLTVHSRVTFTVTLP